MSTRIRSPKGAGTADREDSSADSDATLYGLMLAIGAGLVAATLLKGGAWDAGPTIGALFCGFAIRSLLAAHIRHEP